MNSFCTIITPDYLPYALALRDTLVSFDSTASLNIFISTTKEKWSAPNQDLTNSQLIFLEDLCQAKIGKAIYDKYYTANKDHFRWSMKPVLIEYLLTEQNFEKVIYVDSDICFFNKYHFLWQALDTHSILLTPHWRSAQPKTGNINFELLFTGGLYNAGFLGVAKSGLKAMRWWASACLNACVIDSTKGLYVDQTYLNILPIYFEKVKVLKHQGCNVAGWNTEVCKRVLKGDAVLINGNTPIVFIHFAKETINKILTEADKLLLPHLQQYEKTLQKYQPSFLFKIKHGKLSNQSPFFKRIKNFLLFHLERL